MFPSKDIFFFSLKVIEARKLSITLNGRKPKHGAKGLQSNFSWRQSSNGLIFQTASWKAKAERASLLHLSRNLVVTQDSEAWCYPRMVHRHTSPMADGVHTAQDPSSGSDCFPHAGLGPPAPNWPDPLNDQSEEAMRF